MSSLFEHEDFLLTALALARGFRVRMERSDGGDYGMNAAAHARAQEIIRGHYAAMREKGQTLSHTTEQLMCAEGCTPDFHDDARGCGTCGHKHCSCQPLSRHDWSRDLAGRQA